MRQLLLLSACLVAVASFASADDKDKKEDKARSEPTVTPSAVAVTRKLDQKAFPTSYPARTTLWFVVSVPKKTLLGIDPERRKVDKFEDDKGNSLLDERRAFFQQLNISTDRSAMHVTVFSDDKLPGKGASKLTLKGDLTLAYGAGEKSQELKKVKFEEKGTAMAGDFEITVNRAKGNFGIEGPAFTLKSKTRGIKGVTLEDDEGTKYEVLTYGTAVQVGDKWQTSFGVKKAIKEGTVTVHYFSKEEKVKVPIDLTVGLDLAR
jgi:hypothetical protein